MITVDIKTNTIDNLDKKFLPIMQKAINDALMATALFGQRYAQKSILKGAKTGYVYKRGKITHRASAPGQPPANDTGFLEAKIIVSPVDEQKHSVEIRSKAPYSVDLEYGTMNMAARPFLRPAGWQAGVQGEKIMRQFIDAASKAARE